MPRLFDFPWAKKQSIFWGSWAMTTPFSAALITLRRLRPRAITVNFAVLTMLLDLVGHLEDGSGDVGHVGGRWTSITPSYFGVEGGQGIDPWLNMSPVGWVINPETYGRSSKYSKHHFATIQICPLGLNSCRLWCTNVTLDLKLVGPTDL